MSTARGVQIAITHAAMATAIGSVLNTVLPEPDPVASMTTSLFETVVHVGLNGAVYAMLVPFLSSDDPTSGFVFALCLHEAQPTLRYRLRAFGTAVSDRL